MEKLSGLLLDVYDDVTGSLFREIFPNRQEVPELVKSAHLLSAAERQSLPDDVFALVLRDGNVTLRKFACVDPGNVALSMLYLSKTAGKLPKEAQQRAARNLLTAEDWYKSAGIGGALMSAGGDLMGRAAGWAAKNPMKALGGAMTAWQVGDTLKGVGGRLRNISGQMAPTLQG